MDRLRVGHTLTLTLTHKAWIDYEPNPNPTPCLVDHKAWIDYEPNPNPNPNPNCLVDHKAWIDYESATQENALCLATRHNQLQVLEYLVHRGANPNFIKQDRFSPLMYASKHGAVQGVQKLCECKVTKRACRNTNVQVKHRCLPQLSWFCRGTGSYVLYLQLE